MMGKLLVSFLLLALVFDFSVSLAPITVDLIPTSNRNRPGTIITPSYITVHNTANTNPGAGAKNHASYVKNPTTEVSWHYTVDDKEIYQHLPLNEVGWHAGTSAGNSQSIGIEICENSDGNHDVAMKNAQELIRKVMTERNIPLSRVVPHKHWSGKECPRKILPIWTNFLAGI